jgi:GAF domain-containing protein
LPSTTAIDAGVAVRVGGTVVALLCADETGTEPVSDRQRSFLEILARHAGRVLETLTVQQAVGLSAPQAAVVERNA